MLWDFTTVGLPFQCILGICTLQTINIFISVEKLLFYMEIIIRVNVSVSIHLLKQYINNNPHQTV